MSEKWITQNIPNLNGKVIIVTGANSGTGYEAAKEVARKGAQTIMACRSMDKAQTALARIQAEIPGATAEIMPLDLASLDSIRQFAEAFKTKYTRLDVLLNNAGIMMTPYGKTVDGFEQQFGTNHLGHFALTGLLLDLLLATPGARVVNVSSNAHKRGDVDFDNLMFANGLDYTPTRAYGRSKLANLLFTYELQRRLTAAGSATIAIAAHPGVSRTNLANHLAERNWYMRLLLPIGIRLFQSAAMGALPLLRAATDPQAVGSQYYGPNGPGETRGYPVVVQSNGASHNTEDARKLWQVSEELTGVSYL
ncbi:MAG: SDR family NAD(P)-dependent oxidoreductase [Anaerolineaceae bacterium]|nr:SDR family NAD(P)-dependent oxidoreductase [Anaerolineaceae bacterium]